MIAITDVKGIGPALAAACAKKRITTVQKIAGATPQALAEVPGISEAQATNIIQAAKALLAADVAVAGKGTAKTQTKGNPQPKKGKDMANKKKDKKKLKKKEEKKKKNKKKGKKKKGGKKKK